MAKSKVVTNFDQARAVFGDKVALGAMNAALNKTLVTVRKEAAGQISKEYVVRAGDVKKSMSSRRSRFSTLFAELTSSDVRLPVAVFKPTQKRDGVSVKIKRGQARKVLKRAFIAVMASGHIGVFTNSRYTRRRVRRRKATGRRGARPNHSELSIDEAFTIGMPQMWKLDLSEKVAAERIQTVFARELEYRVNKIASSSK